MKCCNVSEQKSSFDRTNINYTKAAENKTKKGKPLKKAQLLSSQDSLASMKFPIKLQKKLIGIIFTR